MPRVLMETSHDLGREEATRRLREKIDVVRATYKGQVTDLHEDWDENTLAFRFKAIGMKVAGTVTIDASAVRLAANVPLAAMVFKGMIEERVRQELGQLLA